MTTPQHCQIGARPVLKISAAKAATSAEFEPVIVIVIGDHVDKLEFLTLDLDVAERLGRRLLDAIHAPAPSST